MICLVYGVSLGSLTGEWMALLGTGLITCPPLISYWRTVADGISCATFLFHMCVDALVPQADLSLENGGPTKAWGMIFTYMTINYTGASTGSPTGERRALLV